MNKLDCILPEPINMLVTTEGTLKSSRNTIFAMEHAYSKRKSNWKKKKSKPLKKQKKENKPKKDTPKKAIDKEKYFHCNADGYWRRNCLQYLESLKNKKGDVPMEGMSTMLIIESNLTNSSTSNWVLDFSSTTHICTLM